MGRRGSWRSVWVLLPDCLGEPAARLSRSPCPACCRLPAELRRGLTDAPVGSRARRFPSPALPPAAARCRLGGRDGGLGPGERPGADATAARALAASVALGPGWGPRWPRGRPEPPEPGAAGARPAAAAAARGSTGPRAGPGRGESPSWWGWGGRRQRSRLPGTRLGRWRRRPLSEAAGGGEPAPASLAGRRVTDCLPRRGLALPRCLGEGKMRAPARGPGRSSRSPLPEGLLWILRLADHMCLTEKTENSHPKQKVFSTSSWETGFSKYHHVDRVIVEATQPEMLTRVQLDTPCGSLPDTVSRDYALLPSLFKKRALA